MIRVIIADDEPPARDRIRRMIETREDCAVVAECGDGKSTLDTLMDQPADVLFLDIQMPELSGFEVLAALPDGIKRPAIIFSTAFNEHAVKAFEVAAVDYLLKPYNPTRFHAALDRAIRSVDTTPATNEQATASPQIHQLLQQAAQNDDFRIAVRDYDNLLFVRARSIDYIEAAGNYLVIHTGDQSHIHRETLTSMEDRLGPMKFFRINRSILVNLTRVAEVKTSGSKNKVILENKTSLNLTRPLRELQDALTQSQIS